MYPLSIHQKMRTYAFENALFVRIAIFDRERSSHFRPCLVPNDATHVVDSYALLDPMKAMNCSAVQAG